eukprot:c27747_g1_i1 orf=323-4195(+)
MLDTKAATIPASVDVEIVETDEEKCFRDLKHHFVQEWKLLEDLTVAMVRDSSAVEMPVIKRAQLTMEKYQEQSQLLEPHLESMVCPLMQILCNQSSGNSKTPDMKVVKKVCSIVYTLVSICGHKTVVKFFPHQTSDLEFAVALLEICHGEIPETSVLREESTGQWETKCILLLWLSILVLIPFEIASVDTSLADQNVSNVNDIPPLVERIIQICKDYLANPGPMREMAGVLLSRLLTRPDMQIALKSFIQWTHETLSMSLNDSTGVFLAPGIVGAMAAIFKVGGRDVLLHVTPTAWQEVCELVNSSAITQNSLLRKMLVKLIQRIGLTYLPPRAASWRYKGVFSSIGNNLATSLCTETEIESQNADGQMSHGYIEEGDLDVPEKVEEIIEHLLVGLKDKDTVVRWSAAKGVGRVTGRLSSAFADDVVASVLELFSATEGDGSWHGGCLALAELARRGLLVPTCLPKVVPVIIQALHYDVRRGPHSIGSHVRDAAAYVCWAFARAYSPELMRDHLMQLAPALLSIACYDREVNCRRAASAAFQENVGRQGDYPHGIDLVNKADYFSLATRSNAYRNVAVYVAQFEEFRVPLIDELLHTKICHWDRGLRELAAEALSLLVKYDIGHFSGPVLDMLLPWTLSTDLNLRHGATLGIAEVILALSNNGYKFPPEKGKHLCNIVPSIEKARLYRGKGGEIMRSAVSRLIECTALVQLPLSHKVKKGLLDTINDNLKHPNGQIQVHAVASLKALIQHYLMPASNADIELVTLKHLHILQKDLNPAARRGSALAFTALPSDFVIPLWKDILNTLCNACILEENPDDRDAETRVNAVRGLTAVCNCIFKAGKGFFLSRVTGNKSPISVIREQVIECLLNALEDYAVDNRGDVGSWVREASMEGIEQCSYILCNVSTLLDMAACQMTAGEDMEDATATSVVDKDLHHFKESCLDSQPKGSVFDADLATRIVGGLVKQIMEKIDRVREVAGRTLQKIVHNKKVPIPFIPHNDELGFIVPNDPCFNWGVPADVFPRLVHLLKFPEYQSFVISGLVISIGGLSESLSRIALTAMLDFLKVNATPNDMGVPYGNSKNDSSKQEKWLETELVRILKTNTGCDRVILPTFKTIDALFSKGILSKLQDSEPTFAVEVLRSVRAEIKGSKDIIKIITCINVLSHIALIQEPSGSQALCQLLHLLSHRYPKVRKACAEQIYLFLMQKGQDLLNEEDVDPTIELVGGVCWDGPLEGSRSDRIKLLSLFNIQDTTSVANDVVQSKTNEHARRRVCVDENESYATLVRDFNY